MPALYHHVLDTLNQTLQTLTSSPALVSTGAVSDAAARVRNHGKASFHVYVGAHIVSLRLVRTVHTPEPAPRSDTWQPVSPGDEPAIYHLAATVRIEGSRTLEGFDASRLATVVLALSNAAIELHNATGPL